MTAWGNAVRPKAGTGREMIRKCTDCGEPIKLGEQCYVYASGEILCAPCKAKRWCFDPEGGDQNAGA